MNPFIKCYLKNEKTIAKALFVQNFYESKQKRKRKFTYGIVNGF